MLSAGTILVVDDDPLFARMLTKKLDHAGFQCQFVTDPLLAPDCIKAKQINIVLLDIEMPGLNGLQLLRSLKCQKQSVEVIVVSGSIDKEKVAAAHRQGAFGYCVKPIRDHDQLVGLIKSALGKVSHWEQLYDNAQSEPCEEGVVG